MKYVYMLKAGERHYKVGVATNVANRIKTIQTSNPNKIKVVTTYLVKDSARVESSLHKWLLEYKTEGGREWFELSPKQALDLAIKLNSEIGIDLSEFIILQNINERQVELNKKFDKVLNYLALPESDKLAIKKQDKTQQQEDRELFNLSVEAIINNGKASTSLLQRTFRIGYGRAARLMDELEEKGYIGKADGSRPREVMPLVFKADDKYELPN